MNTPLQNLYPDTVQKLRDEISKKQDELNTLRRSLPPEDVSDYPLLDWEGKTVMLSELFNANGDLVLIHNMGRRCVYCTLWADGLNGVHQHMADRAGFVVVSPDEPAVQKEFAESRGWGFRMLSGHGGTFIKDMGFVEGEGDYWPGVSTFKKGDDGKIQRIGVDIFGPGDPYCSVWHFFELLKDGAGEWGPKYKY